MMSDEVVAKYVRAGAFYRGIPARDLTSADWGRLDAKQRALVEGGSVYEMVKAAEKAAKKPVKKNNS